MMDILSDPPRLHSAVVHLPIVLALLGVPLTVLLIILRGRAAGLRWLIVALYLTGAAGAFLASQIGERAEDKLERISAAGGKLTDTAQEELEKHTGMGDWAWLFMLLPAGAVALTAVKSTPVRVGALVLSLALGAAAAGWITVLAHHGGTLVYVHGVGVPASPNNYRASP